MSKLTFVHLSDIHFGQESGGRLYIHNDVRERLVDDAREYVSARKLGEAAFSVTGVIVTGDIAYGGEKDQYEVASRWLDRLTSALGCNPTDVQTVPGNHDVDQAKITPATRLMLDAISRTGQVELDRFLANSKDREMMYGRLEQYRVFAASYGCHLDDEGGHAGDKRFEMSNVTIERMGLEQIRTLGRLDKLKAEIEAAMSLNERANK